MPSVAETARARNVGTAWAVHAPCGPPPGTGEAWPVDEVIESGAVSSTPPAPLLVAEDMRIDVDGVPVCDGLTFRTTAERVLVLGAPRAVALAISGVLPVTRGRLAIRGVTAEDAARDRASAGAALDPPLPPKWTVAEYVQWSARLSGLDKEAARSNALDAMARMQLGSMARSLLGALPVHGRRAVVTAAALATGAPVLILEDPLTGLPEDVARSFARILLGATEDRSWVVTAARMPLTSPLALHAEEAIVASATRVEAQGPPAELAAAEQRFLARVHGRMDELVARLGERGVEVDVQGAHVMFDLRGVITTAELMAMCAAAEVAIVELVPVARGLA